MANYQNTLSGLIKESLSEQNFLKLKEVIIETFVEMDDDYFLDEGEYLWKETIEEIKSVTNYSDMSSILISCGFWDLSDVIRIAKLNNINN